MAKKDILAGKKQAWIADHYGVSRKTAGEWARAIKRGSTLESRKPTGRPARVSREDLFALIGEHPGNRGKLLQEGIFNRFGVFYDIDHVFRLRAQFRDTARREIELREQATK